MPPGAIVEAAGGPSIYLNRKNRTTGISSGFPGLDLIIGGFKRGDLYVLAARPSMGKSALAANIAERVAIDGGGSMWVAVVRGRFSKMRVTLELAH